MADKVCDKCLKVLRPEKRGSLTQWIFDESSCSCNRPVAVEDSVLDNDKNEICPKCFNFRSSQRSGSMTQWIFRRYQCKCGFEEPENIAAETFTRVHPIRTEEPPSEEDFGDDEMPFPVERYKPLRFIAQSSLSTVYKCFDRQLDRLVAIKALSFPDSTMLIGFQKEARTTGSLRHPNIVEVLDFGIAGGGSAYMVLEFVEAATLEDRIKEAGALSEEETIAIIEGVCQALDFAHKKGIYHRDVKPQNILINKDGLPKLIDFGLALMLTPEIDQGDSRGLSLAGTPSYMSPDQFLGRPYNTRSEIYSLGCVIFACLTGRAPYQGENALELANQHATASTPSLQEARPDRKFSERFERIINRCLEKDPQLRYANVSELANDLQIDLHETDTRYDQQTKSGIDKKPIAKNKLLIAATITLALVAGSLVFMSRFANKEKNSSENLYNQKRSPFPPASDRPIPEFHRENSTMSSFEQTMDTTVEKYLASDKQSQECSRLFKEADELAQRENATVAELYSAAEKYKACLALRKKTGAVKPPNAMMTRALVGLYAIQLKLGQFEQLANLEKEIVYYAPDDTPTTPSAYALFRAAAAAYKRVNLFPESLRCLLLAEKLGKKFKKNETIQDVGLELSIGTTYLTLSDLKNAKLWLERARAHLEKLPPNRTLDVPLLFRLGTVYQKLKDYKKSNQSFQEAELLALKVNDETTKTYLGQIYSGWATTLHLEGRLDEAEKKLEKALTVDNDSRNRQAIESLLGTIRKERPNKP